MLPSPDTCHVPSRLTCPPLQAVAVHCAEGRGRTGVMCACYLIYYYDMEPWDAIRIMRRQRPGSVERKVQEETVVRFYTLLADYGKESVDKLDQREKQLIQMQKLQQAELMRWVGEAGTAGPQL